MGKIPSRVVQTLGVSPKIYLTHVVHHGSRSTECPSWHRIHSAIPESVCLGKAYRHAGLPTKHIALIIWTRYAWCQEAAILLTHYCTFQPKAVTILSENKSKAR